MSVSDITIRPARSTDAPALARIAELDSRRLPHGHLLVAEVCGQPVAAIDAGGRDVVADPFRPTADTLELLRLRARQVPRPAERPRRGMLGRLRGRPALAA